MPVLRRRRRLSPADLTPSGLPLSYALPGQGDLLEGQGLMRLVTRDSMDYSETIADQWMQRPDLLAIVGTHSWSVSQPTDTVRKLLRTQGIS